MKVAEMGEELVVVHFRFLADVTDVDILDAGFCLGQNCFCSADFWLFCLSLRFQTFYLDNVKNNFADESRVEATGLLFPGFDPMYTLHGKLVFPVFPIKLRHEGAQKMEPFSWKILSALMMSLDGKNWKTERALWAKTQE